MDYTTSYTYDAASRLTSMTYPDGSVVDRSYNSRSLLDEVKLDSSSVDIRTYDNAGRIATSTYGNGVVTTHTHRADGLVSSIATTNSGTEKVGTYTYGWDENRNKTSETISGAGFMSDYGFSVGTSGYDDEDRLLNWDRTDGNLDQSWTRSSVGNWNQKTENAVNTSYTHNDVHELTSIDSTSINYDANGSPLVSSGGDALTWDLDNRLTDVGTNASFEYDALGRRVSMTEGSSTTTLICPNAQLIAMYASGAAAASPDFTFVYGSYIDEPLMISDLRLPTSHSYFYSRNQQFSITALTNSSGNVVERYAYDAHGKTTIMAPNGSLRTSSSLHNPFAYTGRFLHNDLGLMYFRARYYDPGTGEFISRDPLEYVDGMSLYRGYFAVSDIDPEGTFVIQDEDGETIPIPPSESGVGGTCIVVGGMCPSTPRECAIDNCIISHRCLGPNACREISDIYRKADSAHRMLTRLRKCELRHPMYFCKEDFNWNSTGLTSFEAMAIAECNGLWGFESRRKKCREAVRKSFAEQRKKLKAEYAKCLKLAQELIDDGVTEVPFTRSSCYFCGSLGLENYINRQKKKKRREEEKAKR